MQSRLKSNCLFLLCTLVPSIWAVEKDVFVSTDINVGLTESQSDSTQMPVGGRLGLAYGFNENTELVAHIIGNNSQSAGLTVGTLYTQPLGDFRPAFGFNFGVMSLKDDKQLRKNYAMVEGEIRGLVELSGELRAYIGYAPALIFRSGFDQSVRLGVQFRLK
jgi:hypothetical protein